MNRIVFRRIVPFASLSSVQLFWNSNDNRNVLAKDRSYIIDDSFGTIEFWNSYKKIRLFGYFGCPYCAKVRAYLKFRGIDYEDVEVSIGKPELKGVIDNYKQVPVLAFYDSDSGEPSAVLKDSGAIVSTLEQVLRGVPEPMDEITKFYFDEKGKFIKSKVHTDPDERWTDPDRKFVQDGILHTVAPNLYPADMRAIKNQLKFLERSDNYRDTVTGKVCAVAGGLGLMFIAWFCIFRVWKEHPDQTREEYCQSQIAKFLERKGDERFLGGDRPSIADIEAFAVINLTEGTSAWEQYEQSPELMQWYYSVQHAVDTHQGML